MNDYSEHDIAQWILGAFAVQRKHGSELQFECPVCGHPQFYFNTKKVVGYCHRASCRETIGFEDMIDRVGHGPGMSGYSPKIQAERPAAPVVLPETAVPIGQFDLAVDALSFRGVGWDHIQQFQIHQDDERLYVPVYEGGELVQYNSRKVDKTKDPFDWWKAGPKPYKYASGHPITHYFLGWDECKLWSDIVLVENTFVSMWLRDLHATATFGSHLSDTHIDKILHSSVKHVTFLWDEGTAFAAQKAQRKLKALGVPSNIIPIHGQPDDHDKRLLEKHINGR
jgi:hypothetical protein